MGLLLSILCCPLCLNVSFSVVYHLLHGIPLVSPFLLYVRRRRGVILFGGLRVPLSVHGGPSVAFVDGHLFLDHVGHVPLVPFVIFLLVFTSNGDIQA